MRRRKAQAAAVADANEGRPPEEFGDLEAEFRFALTCYLDGVEAFIARRR